MASQGTAWGLEVYRAEQNAQAGQRREVLNLRSSGGTPSRLAFEFRTAS